MTRLDYLLGFLLVVAVGVLLVRWACQSPDGGGLRHLSERDNLSRGWRE